ncbi:Uncharacterised protein [Staphylococcus aureus]|nr:Uncharacterised protein [Staphylococcus aureus]
MRGLIPFIACVLKIVLSAAFFCSSLIPAVAFSMSLSMSGNARILPLASKAETPNSFNPLDCSLVGVAKF